MPHSKMNLVDLVQGHSYAQRYQRRLAAQGSSWQASGNPPDTLSSGRQASQAATNLDVAVSTSDASNVYKGDSLQHLVRLTKQLTDARSSVSLGSVTTKPLEAARQASSAHTRRSSGDQTTRLPLANVLNQFESSKSRGRSSKRASHSKSTETHGTAQLAYSWKDRKVPEDGNMEVMDSQQASRSASGFQDCLRMQKPQQTQLTESTDAQVAAYAMPAAFHAGNTAAVTPQLALGAAAAASAEASVASKAEPESASGNAAKASEPALDPEQLVDMPVVKALVQCSGTGCEDVLVMCERAEPACRVRQRDSWVSRSFRGEAHSSCTLQLLHKNQTGICIKVSFQDTASTPCKVSFAQNCSLSKAWQDLGSMQLRRDDRQQLQHVFKLGAQHSIKRFLRIFFSGHLLGQASGGHYVDRHLPKQTVTQPLRSVHHAEQSETAVALLQTGVRKAAADAGGQPTAGRHLAVEAQGGNKRSRHDHVDSSLVTSCADAGEELEVGATGRHSPSSPPVIALGGRQMQAVAQLPHCEGEHEKSSFAAAAAKLNAIEVPFPESCGSAAVRPPSITNLDMVLGCSQPRYPSADSGSCACTSSEYGTVTSEKLQHSGRASGQKGICCQHASNQADSSGNASGEAHHPWDELLDTDSQSLPESPAACSSSSSRAGSRSLSISAPHSLLTWAVQQQPHEAAADQGMPGSRQISQAGQAVAALSTIDADAITPVLHLQLSAKQHTAERELACQHSDELLRPSSASQQLRQHLEQSQQQLLQLPSLPSCEAQPETEPHGIRPLPKVERDRRVHWQLQQPVTAAQQHLICHGQSKHAQHSLATTHVGLEEGLGVSHQGTTWAAAGRGSKHLLMSSVDMDAYFGKVANSHPQAAHADRMTGQPHTFELLDHSESFEQLSQSIPDPFAEGYTNAKLDRVLAKSSQTPPKLGSVQAKSGKGLATSGQVLPVLGSNQVNSGRGISKSEQTHANLDTSSRHRVIRDVAKVAQGSWNSHGCQGLSVMAASHADTDMPDLQPGSKRQSKLRAAASNTVEAAPSSMTEAQSIADARSSLAAVNTHGLEQAHQQRQQQAACVQEPEQHSTAAGIPAGTQQTTAAATTDTRKAGRRPLAVQGAWPLMPHVINLRHGQQLRQAAAEAAAVAAGQAAKAESAVPLHTPPTIAFNSKAARHAMAAADAAAAAATLTGGQAMDAATGSQEAPNQGCVRQGPRAGRLHASAPASPMNAGKQHSSVPHKVCHGLLAAVGRRTDCSSDIVVAGAPQYVGGLGSRGQLVDTAWQSCSAGGTTDSASAPNSPLPVKHAAGKESQRAMVGQPQQLGMLLHHKALQQPLDMTAQQAKNLSERQVSSGSDPEVGVHNPQDQWWQQEEEEDELLPEAQQCPRHDLALGSRLASEWQQQQEEEQQMPAEVQQGCQGMSHLGSQWQQQEGDDPFKASAMFPVYAELAGSSPLTDCTNQLAGTGIQSHQHALVQHTFASKSAADVNIVADSALALHRASTKQRCAYTGQQAFGPTLAAEPLPAQRLTCSASDAAAALTSLSEEDFWQAARADLTDTVETVKHRSRLCDSFHKVSTPEKVHQMKALSGSMAQTPKPAMHQAHFSGITPLLDHEGYMKPCRHTLDIEDEDDPMKADWGL
ncbi:hypothetical protein WJX77_008866 [Trebouxia sp. C0004]